MSLSFTRALLCSRLSLAETLLGERSGLRVRHSSLDARTSGGGELSCQHPPEGESMSWNIKGAYVETCSCELMCPCNLSLDHGATYDYCRVTLVFDVREGEIEETDVSGLCVAAIADTPKVMTEGNWRLGVFVDDRATDEQADKLVAVFGGQMGGPMAGLAPLVGEMLGVERAKIDVTHDGNRHSVRVGDAIDFEIEDIVPFGVETGEPVKFQGMFHPVASDLTMAEATRSKINAFGIEYEGKTGISTSVCSSGWSRCCSRSPRSAGGGRRTRCRGWTTARGPTSAR